MMSSECLKNQKGVALVIALIMLLVLTLIGVSSVSLTTFENNIAGNERLYNLAFYTADGGIENFRSRVSNGEFIYSPLNSFSFQITIGKNPCDISYTRRLRSDASGNWSVFKVLAEGSPPSPAQGRVMVECIIEASMMKAEGYN